MHRHTHTPPLPPNCCPERVARVVTVTFFRAVQPLIMGHHVAPPVSGPWLPALATRLHSTQAVSLTESRGRLSPSPSRSPTQLFSHSLDPCLSLLPAPILPYCTYTRLSPKTKTWRPTRDSLGINKPIHSADSAFSEPSTAPPITWYFSFTLARKYEGKKGKFLWWRKFGSKSWIYCIWITLPIMICQTCLGEWVVTGGDGF